MATSETSNDASGENIVIAAETMIGDIMSITIDELKHAQDVWQKLGEAEQDDVIERVERRVKDTVTQCVRMIATQGFTRIPATLEQLTIKDGIKAQLSISKADAARHELTDAQGSVVTLVLADVSQFIDAPHGHKAEADQLGLALDKIAGSENAKPSNDSNPGAEAA